jgi:hypothetical protein
VQKAGRTTFVHQAVIIIPPQSPGWFGSLFAQAQGHSDSLVIASGRALARPLLRHSIWSPPTRRPPPLSLPTLRMLSPILSRAALLASLAIGAVRAIDPVSWVGSKFFYSNGTQFYIKGNTHRPVPSTMNARGVLTPRQELRTN